MKTPFNLELVDEQLGAVERLLKEVRKRVADVAEEVRVAADHLSKAPARTRASGKAATRGKRVKRR